MNKSNRDGIFQTINPKTGKPYPAWRFHYTDRYGKQRTGTGDTSKQRTLELKAQVQARERAIRRKWIDAPKESAVPRDYRLAADEYLAYGNSKGGLGGRPWSTKHAQKRAFYLKFWGEKLGLKMLSDLNGCLSQVEKELATLQKAKKAGKTLQNYADGLGAFCDWCVSRKYLDDDPLKSLEAYDTTPKTVRRALSPEDIQRFLASFDEKGTEYAKRRRLGYEVALASGLRRKELQSLTVRDLDTERSGLVLHSEWTKNRKAGWQPLPRVLVKRLAESAKGKGLDELLLFVARESSTALASDLRRAGIEPVTAEGKVDFHALRVAYDNLLMDTRPTLKEAQQLMRHSDPKLTVMRYGRVRDGRLGQVADEVGNLIYGTGRTTEVQVVSKAVECASVSAGDSMVSEELIMVGREGFEPP